MVKSHKRLQTYPIQSFQLVLEFAVYCHQLGEFLAFLGKVSILDVLDEALNLVNLGFLQNNQKHESTWNYTMQRFVPYDF